jgi:hypothetical protein
MKNIGFNQISRIQISIKNHEPLATQSRQEKIKIRSK